MKRREAIGLPGSCLACYSCRIASIGESLAARRAGNVPKSKPMLTADAIEMKIVVGVMAARSWVRWRGAHATWRRWSRSG